jgi:hypothetical protein
MAAIGTLIADSIRIKGSHSGIPAIHFSLIGN